MIIKQRGHVFDTNNDFVIEQMLKHGGKEVKEVQKSNKAAKDKKQK